MQLARIPNAAKQLGISRQFLWKLIQDGEIPTVTIDGVPYIDMDTVTFKRKTDRKAGGRPKTKKT